MILPTAAFADDPARQVVADACFRASLANDADQVDQAIAQITGWTGLVDPLTINMATICLKAERPDEWGYSAGQQRFVSADDLAREQPIERSGDLCVKALEVGDQAGLTFWRDFILSWRAPVDTRTQAAALRCLNAMSDAPWTWDVPSGRFRLLSDVADARAKEAAARLAVEEARRKAEADRQLRFERYAEDAANRRYNAIRRTREACETLLEDDEVAALTNPVCSPIFLSNGLPD